MHSRLIPARLFLALGTAALLLGATAVHAQENATPQTETTDNAGDGAEASGSGNGFARDRYRGGGGDVEHRRSDHASGQGGRSSLGSSGNGGSDSSGGESGGGGDDGGGGGDVD